MILYRLICDSEHEFEGWFRDSAAYDAQSGAGEIECPHCGSAKVSKALMAPNLATSGAIGPRTRKRAGGELAAAQQKVAKALHKVREHVEKNFDYVGDRFAEEARRIHYGETEERGIYGEASPVEVKDLTEEGVKVAPLPEAPDKAN